jgi:hypothetical protein
MSFSATNILPLISVLITEIQASPSLWAEKKPFAAPTRVGWIPVTGTGMRAGRAIFEQDEHAINRTPHLKNLSLSKLR